MTHLSDAYEFTRAFLHSADQSDEARDELRSLLWLCAEGLSGSDCRAARSATWATT